MKTKILTLLLLTTLAACSGGGGGTSGDGAAPAVTGAQSSTSGGYVAASSIPAGGSGSVAISASDADGAVTFDFTPAASWIAGAQMRAVAAPPTTSSQPTTYSFVINAAPPASAAAGIYSSTLSICDPYGACTSVRVDFTVTAAGGSGGSVGTGGNGGSGGFAGTGGSSGSGGSGGSSGSGGGIGTGGSSGSGGSAGTGGSAGSAGSGGSAGAGGSSGAGGSAGTGGAAGASAVGPSVSIASVPSTYKIGQTGKLTVTLTNANSGAALSGVGFTLNYPSGFKNASTPAVATTCPGASATAAPSGASLALSGAGLGASASCAVEVTGTSSTAGTYTLALPAGAVSSNHGANSAGAQADVTVLDDPDYTKYCVSPPNPIGTVEWPIFGQDNRFMQAVLSKDFRTCDNDPECGSVTRGLFGESDSFANGHFHAHGFAIVIRPTDYDCAQRVHIASIETRLDRMITKLRASLQSQGLSPSGIVPINSVTYTHSQTFNLSEDPWVVTYQTFRLTLGQAAPIHWIRNRLAYDLGYYVGTKQFDQISLYSPSIREADHLAYMDSTGKSSADLQFVVGLVERKWGRGQFGADYIEDEVVFATFSDAADYPNWSVDQKVQQWYTFSGFTGGRDPDKP